MWPAMSQSLIMKWKEVRLFEGCHVLVLCQVLEEGGYALDILLCELSRC